MPKPERLPVPDMRPQQEQVLAFFAGRSEPKGECVVYTGWLNHLGYAQLNFGGRRWMGHRLLYAALHGSYDPWGDILHSCDNPSCIKPEHLRLGTVRENMRESVDKKRAKNSKKTHCPKGHDYAVYGKPATKETNYKPWRRCTRCELINSRLRAGWTLEQAETLPLQPGVNPITGRKGGRPRKPNSPRYVAERLAALEKAAEQVITRYVPAGAQTAARSLLNGEKQ